jgi:hypothetical protein
LLLTAAPDRAANRQTLWPKHLTASAQASTLVTCRPDAAVTLLGYESPFAPMMLCAKGLFVSLLAIMHLRTLVCVALPAAADK